MWKVSTNDNPSRLLPNVNTGGYYGTRTDLYHFGVNNDRSVVSAVINRIAVDVSQHNFTHILKDEDGRYKEDCYTGLNECLSLSANLDQSARDFMRDAVISMCEEGVVALIPTLCDVDPRTNSKYDIYSIRTARVVNWYPSSVKVDYYNEDTGRHEQAVYPKRCVCIIENPFYSVMNEPNSSVQRLKKKLRMMDNLDKTMTAGKLDLLIQLPYSLRSETRREQAKQRKADIVKQLTESELGIAYIDNTEKVTQLNRPLENNLLKEIEYITEEVYSQIGVTKEILNGTADAKVMQNYKMRTVNVYVNALVDEIKRKWLTYEARMSGEDINTYQDPFANVPLEQMAELADKLTRNEIMTSNEIRQHIGLKPSDDPKADMLLNSNLNHNPEEFGDYGGYEGEEGYEDQNTQE